jgi:hypothetical protein
MTTESPDSPLPPGAADPPGRFDAFGLADSLASFGCQMRDRFVGAFSSAWQRLSRRPEIDMNFTSVVTDWIGRQVRLQERLTSISNLLFINFDANTPIFDSDDAPDDFFGAHRGGYKFLGSYTVDGLTRMISESDLGEALRAHGIDDWYVEFDLRDSFLHYGYLRRRCIPEIERYLAYLICQFGELTVPKDVPPATPGMRIVYSKLPPCVSMLNIRWFSLQDPTAEFSARRPRLPGQRFPGSGLGRKAFALICQLAEQHQRDGIVNVPEHFHNAFLYEGFHFVNPEDEGRFQKISQDLAVDMRERGLAAVAWAISLGFLRCAGQPARWELREQVFPVSKKLKQYFANAEYLAGVAAQKTALPSFVINWEEAESYCLSAVLEFSAAEIARPVEPVAADGDAGP